MSDEILAMITKDGLMKKLIMDDLGTQNNRNIQMVYLATWTTSPGLEIDRFDRIMEMFTEDTKAVLDDS